MNPNETFERDLERWLEAEGPASAPAGLHAAVIDRARTMRRRPGWARPLPARWTGRGRGMILLAAAALMLVGGVVAAGSGLLRLPSVVPPGPAPSMAAVQTPVIASPTASATPSAEPSASVVSVRAPSWALTGSMAAARSGGTATLLRDGKVLVVGGSGDSRGSDVSLASAELYDPGTRTWTSTGSMVSRRRGHTATLLPDGKVLVAGGDDCCTGAMVGTLASAELYDPVTGTWTATGSMTVGRGGHTATLLPDGKVLVAGGGKPFPVASAELYDPVTGTWTATGSMGMPRMGHTATLLSNGRVLVAGGQNGDASVLASAELYDQESGTWIATGNMTKPRLRHTATLLSDGTVLVAGGRPDTSSERYSPDTGTWVATGSMVAPRTLLTATLLADGDVLVTGGLPGGNPGEGAALASAELYHSGPGTWTATTGMSAPRAGHTATLLRDGDVLVAGGGNRGAAELYDPGSGP